MAGSRNTVGIQGMVEQPCVYGVLCPGYELLGSLGHPRKSDSLFLSSSGTDLESLSAFRMKHLSVVGERMCSCIHKSNRSLYCLIYSKNANPVLETVRSKDKVASF